MKEWKDGFYGQEKAVYDKLNKEMSLRLEPWDSSTVKAKTLKLADFGNADEVRERVKFVKSAINRYGATEILKEMINSNPYTSKSGLTARIPGKSIGKMVSSEAVRASFNQEAHYLAVANIDKLFQNAIESWLFNLNPYKNNDGLKIRHYLFAPMCFHERVVIVKITVKEYINTSLANKIYSVEVIDSDLR